MAKIALHQGAYLARSPIANAQVCFNLYPETNPQDAPFPVTHYPAPGLAVLSDFTGLLSGSGRGLYQASDGSVIAVIGTNVIRWYGAGNTAASYALLGNTPTDTGQPVSICDNGAQIVLVDGSTWGGIITMPAGAGGMSAISDPAFYGSDRVDYIDTFMIFNQPGTGNFYTTTSGRVLPFDATYAAAKEGWNDKLVCACCLHDNIWLLGNTTAEIWYNAGGTTFPFARMPNSILQQGCVATYSPVIADNALYWLSQDRYGRSMMMRGEGYMARRVSTFAVEDAWARYQATADCVGMAYQLGGHEVVGWYFPTGGAWWGYDASTQMWHQRTYDGLTQPWLAYCTTGWGAVAYQGDPSATLAGDRTGPRILQIDFNTYLDAGQPITRQRSWTHLQQDGNRLYHTRFSADLMATFMTPDTISLDWSDDAGQTYGAPVNQTINNQSNGQYQWRRLGYARDRVYRLTWQGTGECSLNGAYVDVIPHGT